MKRHTNQLMRCFSGDCMLHVVEKLKQIELLKSTIVNRESINVKKFFLQ